MKKRVIAVIVTIVLCLSCTWTALADDTIIEEYCAAEESVIAEEPVVEDEEQDTDEEQTADKEQTDIPEGSIAEGEEDLSGMIIQDGGFPQAEQNTKGHLLDSSDSAREAIYTGLKNKAESIDLISYNITVDEARSLYSQVINENPELFYVNGGLRWSYSGNTIYKIYPSYADYSESQINEYNQRVNQIIASIDSSWTDAEKLMYIHDWIVLNCEYDLTYSNRNAFDVIIGGSAVCQGYSLAFNALARMIGINCSVITSEKLNHAWNLVEADGRQYYVDCTWDDPSNGITVVCMHENFLRSKAGIESTNHTSGDWVNGTTNVSAENEAVDSTMYDNCWWISLTRGAALSGQNAYYVDAADNTVKQYRFNTGTTENVFKCADDSWPVIDKPGYSWSGYFSNVVVRDGKFYYNTSRNIYEVSGSSSSVIYTLSASQMDNGYIYGLGLDGRKIIYNVADSQLSASYNEMFVLEETSTCVEHSYTSSITTEASCTEPGVRTYVCNKCGDTYTEPVPAKGHTQGTAVRENEVAPTCTKAGSYDEVTYCKVCKEEVSRTTVPVEALGHKLTKTEAKDATCTEAGNTEYYTCERCHKLYSDKAGTKEIQLSDTIVAAKGHTAGNIVEENKTEATCTENGSHDEVTYCTVCNTELSRITKTDAALGHVWGEWTVIREATEEEEGLEERICTRDETHKETRVIPKKDHVHVLEKVEMKDSTCTESGNIEYYFCTGCGHIFTDENGSEEIDSESVIIPMKAHQAGDTVTENYVDATCENPGSYDEVTRCTVCEKELSREKKTIAAHGHTEVPDEALAPTCEDSGLTEGSHCSVCGKTIKAREEIPATGHDWGEWKVVTEPTYTSEGLECRYCKNDESHVEEHVIDKLVPEYAIILDRTEAALTYGKTMTLVATITPADAPKPEVTWTSSDKSIAAVNSSGIVTAKGAGTATITASLSDGTKATCEVTVNKAASSISLKAKAVTYTGKTINIDPATVTGSTGNVAYTYYSDSACKNKVTSHKNAGTYYVKAMVAADANYKSATSKAVKLTINKAASTIALKAKTANYTGKTININTATVKGSTGKVTYAYYSDSKCTKKVTAHKNAGTYYVKATVAADQNYKAATSKAVKLVINKIANPMTTKARTGLTASAKTNTTITKAKAFTISKAQGTVTFKKTKGDAKITVASNGNVTVKKGLKKGTTYPVTVKVTAAGNTNYKAGSKTVTLKINVN